jgi:hypothetical protein
VPFPLGDVDKTMILQLQSGAQVRVRLRACVCAPDIEFTETDLNFGSLRFGDCKTMFFQAVNNSAVPCSWALASSVRKGPLPFGTPKTVTAKVDAEARVEGSFEITPRKGTLAPGQRETVSVRFVPSEDGSGDGASAANSGGGGGGGGGKTYHAALPIEINGSPSGRTFSLSGECQATHLEFTPSRLSMKPIRPNDKPHVTTVTVRVASLFSFAKV